MRWSILLLAGGLLASATARAADSYALGPDDLLSVTVYGHEELSRETVVLNDGHFDYPIVGRVSAAGKSPEQVADAISKGLKRELNEPQVTVSVRQPAVRRVYASGLLARAGSFELKTGWRVSHLIAEAGGITSKPDLVKASIVRGDQTLPVDVEAILSNDSREADTPLLPGDMLQVQPNTNLVHIVGQVRNPGDYQLKKTLGVLEALTMAGGGLDSAALSHAQIVRGTDVIKVDLHQILLQGRTEGNVELQPGDTLLIPANEERVAVLGGVTAPGYFDLPDGKPVTLVDAVALAHGATKTAKMDHVAVLRMVDGKPVVSQLDFNRFLKQGDLSQNPAIQAGDVVYVTDSKEKNQNPLVTALGSSFAGTLITRLFIR